MVRDSRKVSRATGETLIDGGIYNGSHRITIHAWDTAGNLYSSSVSFTVTGEGFLPSCPAPSSPGINFCEPPTGAVLGASYGVTAAAKGDSQISAIRLYVDGKAQVTQTNTNQLSTIASVGTQGDHKIAFVAWDTTGHIFSKTRTIHSAYTYSYVDCPPKGNGSCSPGLTQRPALALIPMWEAPSLCKIKS